MPEQFFYVCVELNIFDGVLNWEFNLGKRVPLVSKNLNDSFEESKLLFVENKAENFKFDQEIFWSYVNSNNEESLARIAESLESSEPQVRDSIVPFFIKNKAEQAASSLILKYSPLVAILCLHSKVMYFFVKKWLK